MPDEARARKQKHIADHYPPMRPSEVFAARLRKVRNARELTQTELAYRVESGGVPMNRAALLRIESGVRGLSLDEAFAITAALPAAFAHMLTPPDDASLRLDDKLAIDGSDREWREWIRTSPERRTPGRSREDDVQPTNFQRDLEHSR